MKTRYSFSGGPSQLVLSLFSGIGLLDSGFESHGFCVVAGPEKILGGDVRDFQALPGRFDGIIGGSPCQDFSKARRTPPTGYGLEMLSEFVRIVTEVQPRWFLLENVPTVPNVNIRGYHVQRFDLCPTDLGYPQRRRRHFQFGSIDGLVLNIERQPFTGEKVPTLTASEGRRTKKRTFDDFCQLQGLCSALELPDFHRAARYKVVGNGVHIAVAQEVARAILEATTNPNPDTIHSADVKFCACGCGRRVTGHQKSASDACRKRLQKSRDNARLLQGEKVTP